MDGTITKYSEQDNVAASIHARHILRMAIHGFAVSCKIPEHGLPAIPDRRDFLPSFIRLLHRPDWQEKLQELLQHSMDNDHVDSDMQDAIKRGFFEPNMLHYLVDDLADLSGR